MHSKLPLTTELQYMKFSDFMSSIKEDLNLMDDSGFIDNDRYYKIVLKASEKLGRRIYIPKQCSIEVINHKAELPTDFWKIEMIFALESRLRYNTEPFKNTRQIHFDSEPPGPGEEIVTINKTACIDICNNCIFVKERSHKNPEQVIEYNIFKPLKLSKGCEKACSSNCLNNSWKKGDYSIDLMEGYFHTTFKEGKIFLCYLANPEDEDGEPLIPLQPLLADYYEYAVKVKILEDMLMNSEADVSQKLQLAEKRKSDAYIDAWNYISSARGDFWDEYKKKRESEFYNKWFKMFA